VEQNGQNDLCRVLLVHRLRSQRTEKAAYYALNSMYLSGRSILSRSGASPNAILGKDGIHLAYLIQP
jgi:hypothetical protein